MSLNKKFICLIIVSAIALSAVIVIKTLKQDNDNDFNRGTLVNAGYTGIHIAIHIPTHISPTNFGEIFVN